MVSTADAGEVCLVPDSEGDLGVVDCASSLLHATEWRGFSTEQAPCESDDYVDCWPHFERHEWTISASDRDPRMHQAALPDSASLLYLWLACTPAMSYGYDLISRVKFGIEATGLEITETRAVNGFLNAATDPTRDMQLYVGGCPPGPVVAAILTVEQATPVEPESWGRAKSRYRE